MNEELKIAMAETRADEARGRLIATINELAEQLEPHKLVREMWKTAKEKGADLAEEAVDAVTSRPVAVGGVAAAVAMFLAREPIKDAAVKIYDAMTSKKAAKSPGAALKQPRKPASPPAKPRARPAKRPVKRTARKTETVT